MSGSGKRTHQRQLAKVARKRQQQRALEQRRRRTRVAISAGTAGLPVVIIGSVLLFKPDAKVGAKPSKTPSVTPSAVASVKPGEQTGTVKMEATPPKTVACGASVPTAAGTPKPQFSAPPKQTIDQTLIYTAVITTSCGDIEVKLDPVGAPVATNNFLFLVKKHFYDGIYLHRIVKGFMIQGGDPLGTGAGGPGYVFNTEVNQTIKFGDQAGVLAYGNKGIPDTNGSQFFITVAPESYLDTQGPFTAFGTVTKGLGVLEKISRLPAKPASSCVSATEACRTDEAVYIDSISIKETKPKPSSSPSP
jgi:cyclophilin family peptidyl-prolyl cis-trans isomerase